MAQGNRVVCSNEPKGRRVEGVIAAGETPKPGQVVQIQVATAQQGNRDTWELYNVAADGARPTGPIIILTEDLLQGRTMSDAYAAGERAFGYIPQPGDELNLLIANVSGTATIAKGTMLIIDDTTGKFIATTGSPETEPAMLKEDIVDNAADQHGFCEWTGY